MVDTHSVQSVDRIVHQFADRHVSRLVGVELLHEQCAIPWSIAVEDG